MFVNLVFAQNMCENEPFGLNQGLFHKVSWFFPFQVFSSDLILFEPEEYAVFYGCWPFGYEYLWIYSKRRYLTFETKAMLNNILTEMGIDMNGAMIIDQINCP